MQGQTGIAMENRKINFGLTEMPAQAQSGRMNTGTGTLDKMKKRAPAKWRNGVKAAKKFRLDLGKPIQGQGEGTITFASDYDPCEPAFGEAEWES